MWRREFITLSLARVSHGRSLRWRRNQGGPITSACYLQLPCEATPSTSPLILAFQDELRHLGFVKDQNLTIACRDFGPNIDLSSQLCRRASQRLG